MKKGKLVTLLAGGVTMLVSLTSCGMPTIQMWHGFGAEVIKTLGPMVDAYSEYRFGENGENAGPNETVYMASQETKGGYDGLFQSVMMSVGTGLYPNVAVAYPDHMASYIKSAILLTLDKRMEDIGVNVVDDFEAQYMIENRSFGLYRDIESIPADLRGKPITYGVPFNKSTEVMTVNQTFFDWAGSVDPTIVVPQTWEETHAVGKKMVQLMSNGADDGKAIYGGLIAQAEESYLEEALPGGKAQWKVYSGEAVAAPDFEIDEGYLEMINFDTVRANTFFPVAYDSTANAFITILRQWGIEYTRLDINTETGAFTNTGKFHFNTATNRPKTIEALSYFQQMAADHVFAVPETWGTGGYASEAFKDNKAMMVIGSTAGAALGYNETPGALKHCGYYPIPYNTPDKKFVISQGTNLVLFAKGSEEERVEAARFIKYLAMDKNEEFAIGTGYFPGEKAFDADGEPTGQGITHPDYVDFLENADPYDANASCARVNSEVYHDLELEQQWTQYVDAGFNGSAEIRLIVGRIINEIIKRDYSSIEPSAYEGIVTGAIDAVVNEISEYAA